MSCCDLTQEAQRFSRIDKGWKKIMGETAKNTNVIEACTATGRKDTLQSLSDELELCQKSLSEYLEIKRCAFPRYLRPCCKHYGIQFQPCVPGPFSLAVILSLISVSRPNAMPKSSDRAEGGLS